MGILIKIKLNAMEQTPIDLSRPWEHFSVETEEREMDQKMIKVIEGMPADVQGRFKGLYMLSNQCTTIGDQMDREMEAMEVAFLAKKKPLPSTRPSSPTLTPELTCPPLVSLTSGLRPSRRTRCSCPSSMEEMMANA